MNLFPSDNWVNIPRVPVFCETHTDNDGHKRTFLPVELAKIVAGSNRRITETGDYAVICVGHSSRVQKHGLPEPPVVGFAGSFALAKRNGKQFIVAEFNVRKDRFELFRDHPRRSAELWTDPGNMFLDPIALVGSKMPRLDLGLVVCGPDYKCVVT